MKRKHPDLINALDAKLLSFENTFPLPGLATKERRDCFIDQLAESVRRVKFIEAIRSRPISPLRIDPSNDLFDPLKGAIYQHLLGNIDEAFWLVFISVHFGKNKRAGWRYAREIYGSCNGPHLWDWNHTSENPASFRHWLSQHEDHIKRDGVFKGFGNHRKYQSLDALSESGTGAAFETYVNWVKEHANHSGLIENAQSQVGDDPKKVFDYLYKSMKKVASFGRMGIFDYLTMIGKLNFANITPGSTYLTGATGPYAGALLLFQTQERNRKIVDNWLIKLDLFLEVGMQVLEDALCNWQKSPSIFKPFRG